MMRGTIVCWISDGDEGHAALDVAADLSDRLSLRLVLARVADGTGALDGHGAGENVARRREREGAAHLVARLAAEHGLSDRAEQRSAVGDPATLLGQMAAEEAADMIVIGARMRGRLRGCSESRLVEQLEIATTVPILVALSRTGRGSLETTRQGRRR